VRFGYSYDVPRHEIRGFSNLWTANGFSGTSSADTLTVILDATGKPRRRVLPDGGGISIKMKELLEFAGRTNWLYEAQVELGPNYKEGAALPEGPVGRLTGIRVTLQIKCYNPTNVPHFLGAQDWLGPVCTVQTEPSIPNWVWMRLTHSRGGCTRHVKYHGVIVSVEAEGALRIFDLKAVLTFLVESIVLISLPSSLFRFIATGCLGHLSRIYEGVVNQKFSLSQHIASTAMHLMSSSVSYNKLADTEDGISLSQMARTIPNSLQDFHELGIGEVNAFVLFCFTVALDVRNNKFTNYSKTQSMRKMAARNIRQLCSFSRDAQEDLDDTEMQNPLMRWPASELALHPFEHLLNTTDDRCGPHGEAL